MDETKVQIGNDVILNVDINSEWYISSVGYEYGYEEKAREVTITLRNKGGENKLWRTLGELITDHKDEPQLVKESTEVVKGLAKGEPQIPPAYCKACKHDLWNTPRTCGKCTKQEDGKPSMYEPKDEQTEREGE